MDLLIIMFKSGKRTVLFIGQLYAMVGAKKKKLKKKRSLGFISSAFSIIEKIVIIK